MANEQQPDLQEQYETAVAEERQRHCRAVRFPIFLLAFWTLTVWVAYEGDTMLAYLLLTGFVVSILYLFTITCCTLVATTGAQEFREDEDGCELTDQQDQESTPISLDDGNSNRIFPFDFSETPRWVRKCHEFANPQLAPKDGTYKVVYALIVFGRHVRSEGHLNVKFTPYKKDASTNTGWEITGTCAFGKTPAVNLCDGFVNAEGQLYWAVPLTSSTSSDKPKQEKRGAKQLRGVTVYRGTLNLVSGVWEDGEFGALNDSNASDKGSSVRHEGRITRFEYESHRLAVPSDLSWGKGFDQDDTMHQNKKSAIPQVTDLV
jgi:hypothetical protein